MKWFESTFWIAGAAFILVFFGAHTWGEIERQQAVATFVQKATSNEDKAASAPVDRETLPADEVIAILRIPGIDLELPVRYGTDEPTLRRGPGLIEGTAFPGSSGNIGIAAHRDRHFRGLKDLNIGDAIQLETGDDTQRYIVTDLSIVEPTDIHVLDEIGQPVITLVTCYPFYFIGNAPNRFIVRAESDESNESTP